MTIGKVEYAPDYKSAPLVRDVLRTARVHRLLRREYAAYTFEDIEFDNAVDALVQFDGEDWMRVRDPNNNEVILSRLAELLESDPAALRKFWNEHFPEKELERFANQRGYSFD